MILASASPRRQELLSRAGFSLSIEPADIDEERMTGEAPVALVERLATQKAQATLAAHGVLEQDEALLAADTIVWTGNEVLGKPASAEDARHMLRELAGQTHHVSTGVCLIVGRTDATPLMRSFVETTAVTFLPLSDAEIDAYVATGEPMDKAGAYGIQNRARAFVSHIEGDYSNVVGLPIARVIRELADLASDENLPARLMANAKE